MTFLKDIKIVGVAAGETHSLAWDNWGRVYSWGNGLDGKLGHPIDEINDYENSPRKIKTLRKHFVVLASCGNNYSCALTNKGLLFGWGK